jgi:hypothetical protein
MKDLIDLGNLAFDQLVSEHGELEESRVMFLYQLTLGAEWYILGSQKLIQITKNGIVKNFSDPVIEKHDAAWKNHLQEKASIESDKIRKQINSQTQHSMDGQIIEFGKSSGPWREIPFNL